MMGWDGVRSEEEAQLRKWDSWRRGQRDRVGLRRRPRQRGVFLFCFLKKGDLSTFISQREWRKERRKVSRGSLMGNSARKGGGSSVSRCRD